MVRILQYSLLSAVSVIAFAVGSTPALAQGSDKQETDGKNDGVTAVGEIVVTAQRQSQNVLSVPMSIQAISGEKLTDNGIRQMSDLQQATPGLVPANGSGYDQIYIRGIGNSIFVGADPSVAMFIDDVPRVFGTSVNNFVDVERVEVIKGAPGALYGRNATGGAINIITRQPNTEALAGTFRVSYGEKNTFQGSGFLNIPLSDNIAWTISGERRTHDPYIKNITTTGNLFNASNFPSGSYLLAPNGTSPVTETPAGFPVPAFAAAPGTPFYFYTPQQTASAFNGALHPLNGYNNENF